MIEKKLKTIALSVVVVSLFVFHPHAAKKNSGPGQSETESKLWLVGDSSLHAYSSTAHNLKVACGFQSDKPVYEQMTSGQLKSLDVVVPVKDMRSGKDGLDKNMQKALKAEENPNILFHLEKYTVTPSTIQSQGMAIKAMGILEVAGVKKEITLDGTLTQEGRGLRIQGVEDLLMTDYGVKPPKILMIKTANEVKVHYDLRLDEKGGLK